MSILEKSGLLAKINFPRHLSPPLKRDSWQSTLSSNNRPETTLEITHNSRYSATKNASSAMNETNILLV